VNLYNFFSKIVQKLQGNIFNYTHLNVRGSKKHLNPVLLIDRWERYHRVITSKTKNHFKPVLSNKTVFELGCGPMLGWGPLVLFLGAKKFIGCEPGFQKKATFSKYVKNNYFRKHYNELVSNYGNRMSFNTFYKKLKNSNILKTADELDKIKTCIQIILSNSVLEHINRNNLFKTLEKIWTKAKKNAFFFHAIDMGPHKPISLQNWYKKNIKKQILLNLLRINDFFLLIKTLNPTRIYLVVYRSQCINKKSVAKMWKNYTVNNLKVKTGFIFGYK